MRYLIALLLLWLAAPSYGAPPGASANYEVEVLVFEIRLPDFEGSEVWTGSARGPEPQAITVESAAPSADFAAIMAALRQDARYAILAHKRWSQAAEPRSSGPAVQLGGAGNPLNGTLKFYLSRFLHVELNLAYQPPTGAIGSTAGAADNPPSYVINEQRRIRSNELQYFDHPKFGVLVRVTPVSG